MTKKDLDAELQATLERLQKLRAEKEKLEAEARKALDKRLDKIKALIKEAGITGAITFYVTESGDVEYKIGKARKAGRKASGNGKRGNGLDRAAFAALKAAGGKVREKDGKLFAGDTEITATAFGEFLLFTGKADSATTLRKAAGGILSDGQANGIHYRWTQGKAEKVKAELSS